MIIWVEECIFFKIDALFLVLGTLIPYYSWEEELRPLSLFLSGKNMTMQDLSTSELLRAERSPSGSSSIRRSSRRTGGGGRNRGCRLRSHPINVRDLGLGYDSEEVVLFRYCSGTCKLARNDYHEVLNHLVQEGIIVPKHNDHISQPCCRPILYENLSFLDVHNVWQDLQRVSAAECSCLG